jgi:hypothetical protein
MGVIIVIVIAIFGIPFLIGFLNDSKDITIQCDGCGRYCGVPRDTYKKKEHEAGLVKYYCGRCRGI